MKLFIIHFIFQLFQHMGGKISSTNSEGHCESNCQSTENNYKRRLYNGSGNTQLIQGKENTQCNNSDLRNQG